VGTVHTLLRRYMADSKLPEKRRALLYPVN
jgi:hypothetical protein